MRAVGGYELLSEVGRGGMGVVYRARSPRGGEVALKLVARPDAEHCIRFERERRLLGSFGEEDGFVPLLDAGIAPQGAYLVMPFLDEGTLRQRLARGPVAVEEALALGRALAVALGRAHAKGVVHRDVKPENVLFAKGRPLLSDLGLAKHFDRSVPGASQSASLSQAGTAAGTAGYMAPEQADDAKGAGPPADVFALGAVLHECLSGQPAFVGATLIAVLKKVALGVVEPVGRRDVPAFFAAAIARALAPDPTRRFPDGAAFARALDAPPSRPLAPVAAGAALAFAGALAGVAWSLWPQPAPAPPAPHASPALPAPEPAPPSRRPEAEALLARAVELSHAGDLGGASATTTKAIEADPKFPDAFLERGAVRTALGDLDGAIADFSRAIELAPVSWQAWSDRGLVRLRKGDREGLADLDRSVEVAPGDPLSWANRGASRREMGDLDGAIADEAEAVLLDPACAAGWRNLADAHVEKGQNDAAIAESTRALAFSPGYADAWVARAAARFNNGDRSGALADAEKAVALEPLLASAWKLRGFVRSFTDDREGAIADLRRFLELAPNAAEAPAMRKRLEALEARR